MGKTRIERVRKESDDRRGKHQRRRVSVTTTNARGIDVEKMWRRRGLMYVRGYRVRGGGWEGNYERLLRRNHRQLKTLYRRVRVSSREGRDDQFFVRCGVCDPDFDITIEIVLGAERG